MDILFIFTYMQLYTHTHNVCEKINSFSSWDISDTLCWGNPLWLPCSHWVRGSARPPKERGWRAGAFGHCFPLWGPGQFPCLLSLPRTLARSFLRFWRSYTAPPRFLWCSRYSTLLPTTTATYKPQWEAPSLHHRGLPISFHTLFFP